MTICIVSSDHNESFAPDSYSAMNDKYVLPPEEVSELFPHCIDAQRAIRLAADLVRMRFRVKGCVGAGGLTEEQRTVGLLGTLLSAIYSASGKPTSKDAIMCVDVLTSFVESSPNTTPHSDL